MHWLSPLQHFSPLLITIWGSSTIRSPVMRPPLLHSSLQLLDASTSFKHLLHNSLFTFVSSSQGWFLQELSCIFFLSIKSSVGATCIVWHFFGNLLLCFYLQPFALHSRSTPLLSLLGICITIEPTCIHHSNGCSTSSIGLSLPTPPLEPPFIQL
eukprot:Gb_31895 [translate_table: standard]